MEIFLMVLCMSMFGLAITAAAFGAATRPAPPSGKEVPPLENTVASAPSHFFVHQLPSRASAPARVPVEALLLQIENHVRLEQAAAESFLESPTATLLHSRTISPLVQ